HIHFRARVVIMSEEKKEIYLGYSTDKAITPFYQEFLEALDQQKLMKSVCTECGTEFLPPRQHCQKCLSLCELKEFTETEAKLRSYVIVDFAPESLVSKAPYVVAIGEFPSGLRLTAHITNLMSVPEVGMDLKLAYDRIDDKSITYKFLV
ncbi:MAG: OB-fold domain-containing protein, partial [Candidatus Thorarchaeota archaeon]|nr:OB-fold domain-containing protein [Candidatus Thorarchaeota archaeon]